MYSYPDLLSPLSNKKDLKARLLAFLYFKIAVFIYLFPPQTCALSPSFQQKGFKSWIFSVTVLL
jgi:hypothetical protein